MSSDPGFDPSVRYIRIVQRRDDGMVEFEFAVGEPDIYVEMILPAAEFAQFCSQQGVAPTDAPCEMADTALSRELGWNLKSARDDAGKAAPASSPDVPISSNGDR